VFLISVGAVVGITSVLLVLLLSQARVLLAMARDGLIPDRFFGAVHPRFQTPHKATILTGVVVATVAALFPLKILADLVNIGTLMAFVVVCAAVIVMRRTHPDLRRPFRTPLVPLVPILGIAINLAMMLSLGWHNWLRLGVWLAIGLVIYFGYGQKRSTIRLAEELATSGVRRAAPPGGSKKDPAVQLRRGRRRDRGAWLARVGWLRHGLVDGHPSRTAPEPARHDHPRDAADADLPPSSTSTTPPSPAAWPPRTPEPVTVSQRLPGSASTIRRAARSGSPSTAAARSDWLSFQSFLRPPRISRDRRAQRLRVPSHQRRGVARTLLTHAVAEAPRLSSARSSASSSPQRAEPGAVRALGFERWALLPRVAELDGVERDLVIVGRRVTLSHPGRLSYGTLTPQRGGPMIKLYGIPRSRTARVLWMLEELQVPYEQVPVSFIGDVAEAEYLKINPNGHIPALQDGDLTLFESLAINLYLARKYDKGLWPKTVDG
jgi:hypothetical protein